MAKLYTSKAWLRRKLYIEHKTPAEIAQMAGVSRRTIERAIEKFGL